jgi:pimeloyl-ACP methyl ester carboxylesterase
MRQCHPPSRVATLVAIFALACVGVERLGAQPAPLPPGSLIDVGGYRVHLNCVGSGRPVVVITGSGYSVDWALVQQPVSSFTRVCTYDPSGSAWSDRGGGPETTCDSRVSELHRLLHKAAVDDPIVLTGHSIGAVWARMYADRYPTEVQGMVLSDHAGRYRMAVGPPAPSSATPATPFGAGPAVLGARTPMPSQDESLLKLPPTQLALHRWAASLPHESSIPLFDRCIAQLDTSKASRPGALGDRPLIVIGNATLAGSEDYVRAQSRFLALSRRARAMISPTTAHQMPLDDPGTIVRAVKQVVDDIRKR